MQPFNTKPVWHNPDYEPQSEQPQEETPPLYASKEEFDKLNRNRQKLKKIASRFTSR